MRRALRGVAAGVVLAAATLSTTWGLLFFRPLPTIDGYYRLLGLHERAEVIRDVFGIPRVYARNTHDLFFLQGYVTAQDRLGQMDLMRAAVAGSAAHPAVGSPDVREALEAYAAGVNKFIAQHAAARALPGELVLAGRRPAPWSPADSVAIARGHLGSGSRCVVAPASRSLKGHGMLAADVAFDGPAPGLYEIGLYGSDRRAIGVSLPGVPGLVAGHNAFVAWAVTAPIGRDPTAALEALLGSLTATAVDLAYLRPIIEREITACAADIAGSTSPPTVPIPERRLDLEGMRGLLGPARAPVGARLLIDLADADTSRSAVSHGASGHRGSAHFDDQAPLWTAGQTHRLPFTRGAIGRTDGEIVFRAR